VLAQAPGSVNGSFKVTEQGEVIFARYGQPAIAKRHLEQVGSAVLLASSMRIAARTAAAAQVFSDVAARIDEAASAAFRRLVEADGFADWFARISPLGEIGGLRIGSRPAKRGLAASPPGAPAPATDLADLRAIPWVFAWSQTRMNLPGWFGLGSGLAAIADAAGSSAVGPDADGPGTADSGAADPGAAGSGAVGSGAVGPGAVGPGAVGPGAGGPDVLRRAYREWPLFRVLLENAEMSLAKTDRRIGARYLALGGRPDLTELVLAEYDLTRRLVLTVTGHDRLLANRHVLSRAVTLRDPYVDALSFLQLRALATLREDDPASAGADSELAAEDRDRIERLLLLTVNGVAAGLQNTG
jgi:phosphoenolpyruvate carboxylase